MATKCWFECPECHEENDFDWDTFSFAGNFTFSARCKCGVESVIYIDVSAQQSVQPTPPLALVCECGSLYGVHEEFCPKYKSAGG